MDMCIQNTDMTQAARVRRCINITEREGGRWSVTLSADVFHLHALHTSSTIWVTAHTAARTTVKSVK